MPPQLAHVTKLSKKETDVFNKLMKCYDKKEYRKTIKYAGETRRDDCAGVWVCVGWYVLKIACRQKGMLVLLVCALAKVFFCREPVFRLIAHSFFVLHERL